MERLSRSGYKDAAQQLLEQPSRCLKICKWRGPARVTRHGQA